MSSDILPNSSPIIRVCRKRSADPRSALVVNLKRRKADHLIFSLFQTSDVPELDADSQAIIDFQQSATISVSVENELEPNNPLAFANDSVNEIGGPEPRVAVPEDVITVNGRPMVSSSNVPDEFVFDFYKISRGVLDDNVVNTTADDWDMRFATRDEELLYGDDESDSDNGCRDDDDDENEEDNWRNDYPDENESSDENERDSSYDGDYGERDDIDGDVRLRLQRFGIEEYDDNDEEDEDF